MRQDIIDRALSCIDEILIDNPGVDIAYYPLDNFLDEAARRVLLGAPLHAISLIAEADVICHQNDDGSGYIELPEDFLRLRCLRMRGWQRAVIVALTEDDPRYALQSNKVTRGGVSKPIAVLVDGNSKLEYYSIRKECIWEDCRTDALVEKFSYIPFVAVDESYPERLVDVTAWLLASMVLAISDQSEKANVCMTRYNELISVL